MAMFVRPTAFRSTTRSLRGAFGAMPPGMAIEPAIAGIDLTEDAPDDGFAYGRMNAQWVRVVPLEGGIPQAQMEGPLYAYADPTQDLEVSTKGYIDNLDLDGGDY